MGTILVIILRKKLTIINVKSNQRECMDLCTCVCGGGGDVGGDVTGCGGCGGGCHSVCMCEWVSQCLWGRCHSIVCV